MGEGNSIQATLTLKDELTPRLRDIASGVAELSKALNGLNAVKLFGNIVADTRNALLAIGALFVFLDATIGAGAAGWLLGAVAAIAAVVTAILFIPWDQVADYFKDGLWNAVVRGLQYLQGLILAWWFGLSEQTRVNIMMMAGVFQPVVDILGLIGAGIVGLTYLVTHWREAWQSFQSWFIDSFHGLMKWVAAQIGMVDAVLGPKSTNGQGDPQANAAKAAQTLAGQYDPGNIKAMRASIRDLNGGPTIQGNPSPAAVPALGGSAGATAQTPASAGAQPATPASGPVQIQPGQGVINLDGHSVGTWLMQFIGNQSGGPNSGPSAHDPFAAFTPAGVALLGMGF